MTTFAYSTPVYHASTADLRIYGAELNAWMTAAGLVQTADTGQINWATVTLPGTLGTSIGYEIWRFADSSIYFKLEYTTNISAVIRVLQQHLTVGSGSNGSGTITGIGFPRTDITNAVTANAQTSGTVPCPTYICCTADFFGIVHKMGGPTSLLPSYCAFAIEKMLDDDGAVSNIGYVVSWQPGSLTGSMNKRAYRSAATATLFAANTSFCVVPGAVTVSSSLISDRQVWAHAQPNPRSVYSGCFCTLIPSELPAGMTFAATLLGATERTYISIGLGMGSGFAASASWGCGMLWE